MHNVIVGTAGHVDHGKTCLIKALTGIETDRLKEEKKRGITIELGFADMQDTGEQHIGIIDVPGHEKFVKNMLAGIGGIDMVLLVIAGDEGIMPQTVEHFEILKMLDIQKGIVVLTKADLVEEEWLEVVKEDVKEHLKGTFLENAPMVEVSSFSGHNMDALKNLICEMAKECGERKIDSALFRLPIDRVFTIDGFGTVVTGTLTEGSVKVGDEIEIYPERKTAKVRNLQVHGNMVQTALAGQRTAVNLVNIKKEELNRGDVLAAKGSMEKTMMLDVKVRLFRDSPRTLKNGDRLHLYYGSAETLCKAILLDREVLESGESAYAQLRMEKEISVKKGDRFILRFYSPVETLGGGIVLDASPSKHKRYQDKVLEGFNVKEEDTPEAILLQVIKEESKNFLTLKEYAVKLGWTEEYAGDIVKTIASNQEIQGLSPQLFVHKEFLSALTEKVEGLLEQFHQENPLNNGMVKEEFRKKLSDKIFIKDGKIIELLVNALSEQGTLRDEGNLITSASFTIQFTEEQVKIKDRLEKIYLKAGYEIPEVDEVISREKDKKIARQMIEVLASQGTLYKLNYQFFMHKDYWEKVLDIVLDALEKQGSITLAEYRDLLGTSRKYAMMILDHLDEKKVTQKVGDSRVLMNKK